MSQLGRRQAGMTLVEILVAISVASLVLFACVAVYRTLINSLDRQQNSRQAPAYAALDQLRYDLSQCAQVPSTNIPAFVLQSREGGSNEPCRSTLAFSSASLPSAEAEFSSLEVTRIRYTLVQVEQGMDGRLIRETMCVWGSNALAPAISNVILDHVTAFEVSVLAGAWTNNWASSSRTLVPQAARVRLDWRTAPAVETAYMEIFIPAGNVVPGGKPVP